MIRTFLRNLFLLLFLFLVIGLNAQVTIGTDAVPNKGALLDLKENANGISTKGLSLPRVSLITRSSLQPCADETQDNNSLIHVGLIVYNMTTITTNAQDRLCPGVHVWNGTNWMPITGYPVWDPITTLLTEGPYVLTFLDPGTATDWPDNKNRNQYQLGYLGTYTDPRDNEVYNYTRFYVAINKRTNTYQTKVSYSCDPNTPNYVNSGTSQTFAYGAFEDGVWMADNLRARTYSSQRDNGETIIQALSGATTAASNTATTWQYPNGAEANVSLYGLLYSWAAATNSKGGATGLLNTNNEAGVNEGKQVQGVCPTGWHLPSDREWTNLENGIIVNTIKFSSTPNIGVNNILPYNSNNGTERGTLHGQAMRNTSTGTTNVGTSKAANAGGFNALISGFANTSAAISSFGVTGHYWTSSSYNYSNAWKRALQPGLSTVTYSAAGRTNMFSVRCMRNQS